MTTGVSSWLSSPCQVQGPRNHKLPASSGEGPEPANASLPLTRTRLVTAVAAAATISGCISGPRVPQILSLVEVSAGFHSRLSYWPPPPSSHESQNNSNSAPGTLHPPGSRVPSVSPSLLSQGPREEDTKPKSFLKNASGLLQAASDDSSPGQQGMQTTLRGLSSGIRHRCEGVAMASEARERSVWPFCLPMPGHRDTEQGKWGGGCPAATACRFEWMVLRGARSGFYSGHSPSARPLHQRPRCRPEWSSSAGQTPSPRSCGLQGRRVSGGSARQWVSNRATVCNPEGAQRSRPARDFGQSRR